MKNRVFLWLCCVFVYICILWLIQNDWLLVVKLHLYLSFSYNLHIRSTEYVEFQGVQWNPLTLGIWPWSFNRKKVDLDYNLKIQYHVHTQRNALKALLSVQEYGFAYVENLYLEPFLFLTNVITLKDNWYLLICLKAICVEIRDLCLCLLLPPHPTHTPNYIILTVLSW